MKDYNIQITETLALTVTVAADNAAQAREIVMQRYKDSEFVLDASHFKDVTFIVSRFKDYER